jgi:uncharacterized protein YndB with AHSA1/START domain
LINSVLNGWLVLKNNKKSDMILVENTINASLEKVWEFWTKPEHIIKWSFASEDWHAPYAENDLTIGGTFKTAMAAKDGSFSFNYEGVYTNIRHLEEIEYEIVDGRKVFILFSKSDNGTKVVESFQPETINPEDLQKAGWQAILNNFKRYVEQE